MEIRPTKGIQTKIQIHGMYEEYFISYWIILAIEGLTLAGMITSLSKDSLSFTAFSVFAILLIILAIGLRFLFQYLTKNGDSKHYPKEHVRINNKDL